MADATATSAKIEIHRSPDFRESEHATAIGLTGKDETGQFYWTIVETSPGANLVDFSQWKDDQTVKWNGPYARDQSTLTNDDFAVKALLGGLNSWEKQQVQEQAPELTDKQRAYLDSAAQKIGPTMEDRGRDDRAPELERD